VNNETFFTSLKSYYQISLVHVAGMWKRLFYQPLPLPLTENEKITS